MPNLGQLGRPKGSKRESPRGSQNGAKKEKKNEVKLREVKSAKKGMKGKSGRLLRGRWGSKGRLKTAQDRPKTTEISSSFGSVRRGSGQERPESSQKRSEGAHELCVPAWHQDIEMIAIAMPCTVSVMEKIRGRAKRGRRI